MNEIQQTPQVLIENYNDISQSQNEQSNHPDLEVFLAALQQNDNLGSSLESFLQALPTGEQVTLSISLSGAGKFEVVLRAGETLDQALEAITTQFRLTADSVADDVAGIDVQVNTAAAETALEDVFHNGSAQDLRGLLLSITGSAMGQSQSRTYEISAFSFNMSDGSRITFSVINPDGKLEGASQTPPDVINSSTSEEDSSEGENTVLDGISIQRNVDFTYNGNTYRFTEVDSETGKPIIFRISERGSLIPLTAEESTQFNQVTRIDPSTGNMLIDVSSGTITSGTEIPPESTQTTRLIERGMTAVELNQQFYIQGISATFSVQRSGNSYILVLHRDDGTQTTVANVAGARIFPNAAVRPSLSDAEEEGLSVLIAEFQIMVQGSQGNETVRIVSQ